LPKEPVGKWISIIYRYSIMHANEMLKPYNLTGSQLMFFIAIVDMPGITQEELSEYLKINKSTTAKVVKILEKNGHITKSASKKDRRAFNLYPTKNSIELRKNIRSLAFQWDDILFRGFNDEEKKKIYDLIERMACNADEYINKRSDSDGN
jgi:DNA-binding MarR family transcriptional regulator